MGNWFRRVWDPILLEFLRVWGRIEVEGRDQALVRDGLRKESRKSGKRFHEYRGYLAEVHLSQVLLNSQNSTLPGKFFNSGPDVAIPRFSYVRHRVRPGSGKGRETDVPGAAGPEQWVCQSKWVTGRRRTGIGVLRELAARAERVRNDMEPETVRMWIFANSGLSGPALGFAEKHGILWSSRQEFDRLLIYLGLRPLPDL